VYDDGIVGGVDAAVQRVLEIIQSCFDVPLGEPTASLAADLDLAAGTLKISQEGHASPVDCFAEYLLPDAARADGSSYLYSGRGSNAG
jgi:hypothetical protein